MKQLIPTFFLAVLLVSCGKDQLSNHFNCKDINTKNNLKEYRDFLKNFYIEIPDNWKTELFYDEYSSSVFAADTTKNLTESFLLDISWRQGELNIDDAFKKQLQDSVLNTQRLTTIKDGMITFKDKPSFFNLAGGKQGNYNYQFFQLYVKTGMDEYITLTSKVYGDKKIARRICESIAYFNTLRIIK
ncbi:MAG: hypothetical protein CSA39_02795 [Flavobacteriales bacterium]|nr:MAG: hypothetical protein CSA39_02795 [Flavobacteriales bacterium]